MMVNGQQQSAHDFVMVALGSVQHTILNMLNGAEATINEQRQQIESLKKENEELKKKIVELSPVEKV